MTTSKIILKVLESEPTRWFKSYELNQQSTAFGWIGAAGARRTREMAAKGLIEVRHIGKYAEYKAKERVLEKPEPIRPPQVLPQFRRESVLQAQLRFI